MVSWLLRLAFTAAVHLVLELLPADSVVLVSVVSRKHQFELCVLKEEPALILEELLEHVGGDVPHHELVNRIEDNVSVHFTGLNELVIEVGSSGIELEQILELIEPGVLSGL